MRREVAIMNFENLPESWKVVRLGRVAEIYDYLRVPINSKEREKRKAKAQKLYPYYGANGQVDWIDDYIFDGEYLLVAEDGGFWGSFEKSSYLVKGKFWVNNHAHILRAQESLSSNKYLEFFLNYENLNTYISGTTRGKLTQEILKAILIPLPPLPEQKRIVEILSLAEDLIKKQKEAIALIDKILMAKFLEMFGDPATNPKGWKVRKLGEVAEIVLGKTPHRKRKDFWNGGTIPWVKIQDMNNTIIRDTSEKITNEAFEKVFHNTFVPKGTLLLSFKLTIGKTAFLGIDAVHNEAIVSIFPDVNLVDKKYLFYLLPSLSYSELTGGAVKGQTLNKEKIKQLPIPLPPIELQKQFAQIIEEFEKKRQEMQKTLEVLESLFKLLQKKAFTGELTAEWREQNKVEWEIPQPKERQAVLLASLYYHQNMIQKPAMITVAMKSAFLLQQDAGLNLGYNFIPYKYGPFSKEVYEDIEELEKNLLVERVKPKKDIEMTEIRLVYDFKDWTERIIDSLPEDIKETVKTYVEKYGKMELNELLGYVYAKYPEYAVKSKRKRRSQ